jgi:subtilisin family serine protease
MRQRTTQATAVVSGAAALVLQQHPTWTNNQVKALLTGTTTKVGPQTDTASARAPYWWLLVWAGKRDESSALNAPNRRAARDCTGTCWAMRPSR